MSAFTSLLFGLTLLLSMLSTLHARDLLPTHGDQVLVKLPPRLKTAPMALPNQVLDAAQQAISLARSTSDPRHLGHAQALLSPWWGQINAPVRAMVLQATVEQSQHRFSEARNTLHRAVAIAPNHAQAWLTLATLDRLQARFEDAYRACEKVAMAGEVFYARVCQAELLALRGQHDAAFKAFQSLVKQSPDIDTQAWVYSLMGEAHIRAGRLKLAEQALETSLQLSPDAYTSLALADMMLQAQQPQRALDALKDAPLSDAVLMRKALARRQSNNLQWQRDLNELKQRFDRSRQRGDVQALHARELAWVALHLQDDPQAAQHHALVNLTLQKEPIDWWLALRSTRIVADAVVWKRLRSELMRSGLRDTRLNALLEAWKP